MAPIQVNGPILFCALANVRIKQDLEVNSDR